VKANPEPLPPGTVPSGRISSGVIGRRSGCRFRDGRMRVSILMTEGPTRSTARITACE